MSWTKTKILELIVKYFRVGLVGLEFGAEFIPIYQAYPGVRVEAICRRSREKLDEIGTHFEIDKRYTDFNRMIEDPDIDFVHINSPIEEHARQSIAALRAGKHVICTVPMATNLDECAEVVRAVKETGLQYMMAETVVYSREYLFIRELYEKGELGKLQFIEASHTQDMQGWPDYWKKMVPMHYATHVVGPVLGLANGFAEAVSCIGSGTVSNEVQQLSGNSFAVESCHIMIRDSDVAARVWRFLWDTARQYRESVNVYGSLKSFEWQLIENESPIIHTAGIPEAEIPKRVVVPDYAHLLPEPIQGFTQSIENEEHLSFVQGGGHGGSHPHMIHEFISSLKQQRQPYPDAIRAANWTSVGICAHQSALNGGRLVKVPEY